MATLKKARRQHIRTTKNRKNDVDATWTPFRAAEKKYKARYPPLDLTGVLDLTREETTTRVGTSSEGTGIYTLATVPGVFYGYSSTAHSFDTGLVLLPSFVSPQVQHTLVRWALRDHARHPNETNLDAHYVLPPEGLWNAHLASLSTDTQLPLIVPKASECTTGTSTAGPRALTANDAASKTNLLSLQALPKPPPDPSPTVHACTPSELVPKLRWANIGWSYHWGTKQYDFPKGRGHVDARLRDLCRHAVNSVPWEKVFGEGEGSVEGWGDDDWRTWNETYDPDAGIVNFYQTKDTLMAHVDRSEVCATSPLVSISLGNAAIFLIGGLTRDVEPVPILLRSGDVIIMSGPACRRAYHADAHIHPLFHDERIGVPRILDNTLPEHFSYPHEQPCTRTAEHGGDCVTECECKNADLHGATAASAFHPDAAAVMAEAKAWEPYRSYLKNARINVNVRQVFPKGFVPGASDHHDR
ncbi:hypothetical protein V8B97DRAFT_1915142 [Scleroderma yunnanense]